MRTAGTSPLVQALAWSHHVRVPDVGKREEEGQKYKKGYEVRFTVTDRAEERELRACLAALGLKGGKAFVKHTHLVVPVYGKAAVKLFGG